ncbi:bifunctional 3-(3-hydroxy-phenyl)propionate/3-hydroxycinnamic acid hydroxylase [Mycobacterium sp. 663a-19]|uniref:bifunctional 3-(3-hydroxy-phenyl)propionate/3-hydroxycinnamic acid hydroxylase n=1 Tax=Mycobacterium sp. 663a-19 TaxID=2986148 RepID=UPI002D1E58FC|nr:bifunctional 3-(3-hydroxy-phenyl)propionate/3-hydroxycinnamic acid hydroxylase [Mycobacterium sp. 663a-19]MEB3980134.1 bifunctional 3-(3-hydroxy-phenyl)propionate/3-hydroxycinnamic acid hydroxylase [Mycobacterium sp. 663a-19]
MPEAEGDGAPPAANSVDVAVCGAGPVGLTAAALLARRGLAVAVFEKNESTSDEPKAISIDDEALLVFQQAGIVESVLDVVVPGTGTRYYDSNGVPLFHARGAWPFRYGYPFKNPFAQPDLEKVLVGTLRSLPRVVVRFATEVTDVEQTGDRVRVHASHNARDMHVDASYALGCDGGRSAIRQMHGVTMSGRSHSEVWLVVDTVGDTHTERYAMHHGDPHRPHVIVPGLNGRCRYEFRLFDGEGEAGAVPSFDLIRRLVSRYRSLEPEHVERAVNYRFNALVADQWMIGRSFLLGDAAHMMPPFAGQGLNSGIRDAANLAWKIAGVIDGRLDPAVLDSYERERRPHAAATVRLSEQLGRIVMTTSTGLARRRDSLVRMAMRTSEGREYLEHMRYRPPQHYTEGLVISGDQPGLVGVPIGQPVAFDSAAHRLGRLDDTLGNGWAILGVDISGDDWTELEPIVSAYDATTAVVSTRDTLPHTAHRVLIDVDGALHRELGRYSGRFVLLRPDRFVAAAWLPSASPEISAQLLRWSAHRIAAPAAI